MQKRGQAVMEYVLVTALFLLVFVPTTYIFLSQISKSSDELSKSKLTKLGTSVVNTAEEIFYQGPPSSITLREDMPSGVQSMYIVSDWNRIPPVNQLIFNYSGGTGGSELLVFTSRVNINGSFSDVAVTAGQKNIEVTASRNASGVAFVRVEVR